MSVICRTFVENSWRKDLCSNCFRSEEEHAPGAPPVPRADPLRGLDELTHRAYSPAGRAGSPALTDLLTRTAPGGSALKSTALLRGLQSRQDEAAMMRLDAAGRSTPGDTASRLASSRLVALARDSPDRASEPPIHSAVNRALVDAAPSPAGRGILVLEGRGGGKQRRSVAFAERHEVIGVGGDPAESEDEEDELDEPGEPEQPGTLSAEERQLLSLTQRNTDFNSINSNLSGTSRTMVDWLDDNDRTTERSALTGRHKKFTPLVSIAPFSSGPRSSGGVKVNLVAPMKNGEIITESRNRFEMVEKRSANDPIAKKMAEKITRLDDLIDEKPKKKLEERTTTSVEITSADSERSRSLATESVSVTEFADSPRDAASPPPPPLVETRLSFSIGGRRESTPTAPEAPPRSINIPRPSLSPASRRGDHTCDEVSRKDPEQPQHRNNDVFDKTANVRSSPSKLKEEDQPRYRSSSAAPKETSPKSSFTNRASSEAPSPARRSLDAASDEVNGYSDTGRPVQNGGVKSISERDESLKRTDCELSGTVGSLTSEVLEAVDKAFPRSNRGSVVTLRPGNETSLTSITSDASDDMQDDVTSNGGALDSLTLSKTHHALRRNEDVDTTNNADVSVERKQNGYSAKKVADEIAEESKRSTRSSALQKLIDADVDNQNGYNAKLSALHAQSNGQNKDSIEPRNNFTSLKSRYSDRSNGDTPTQTNGKASKIVPVSPQSNDSIVMFAQNASSEADIQPKDRAFVRSASSKPSARASFLHSLTNSQPEDEDSCLNDIIGSSIVPSDNGKSAENGNDAMVDNAKATPEVAEPRTTPPVQRTSAPKANESIIRSSSKPSGGLSRPPIMREKPKIAAKPPKLHRLSRATSVESDHSPRSSPEVRRDSVDREMRAAVEAKLLRDQKPEQSPSLHQLTEPKTALKTDITQSDAETGPVCVAVKSPVLDPSERLTKLVESAKPVPEEPKEQSHLTINVSPPRPPVRRESLTRKERALQREKELEKQREELEKRQREEHEEPSEVRPVEARREHRLAPQPPGHQEVKRTVSVDSEAVREHRPAPQPPVHQDLKRTVSNDSEAGREKRPAPEPPVDMALRRTFSNDSESGRGPAPQPPTHLNVKRTISSDGAREHRRAPKPPGEAESKRPVSKDYEANRTAIANLLSFGNHGGVSKRPAPKAPENTASTDEVSDVQQVDAKGATAQSPTAETPEAAKPQKTSRVWSDSPLEEDSSTADSASCATDVTEGSGSGSTDLLKRGAASEEEADADANSHDPSHEEDGDADAKTQNQTDADNHSDEIRSSVALHKIEESVEHNHEPSSLVSTTESDSPAPAHAEVDSVTSSKSSEQAEDKLEQKQPAPASNSAEAEPEHIPPITLKVESALPAPVPKDQASGNSGEAIPQSPDSVFESSPSSVPAPASKLRVQDDSNPYASTAIFDRRSSFKPDLDDDDDLPPSASMRSSSVSPRSRKRVSNVVSFDPGAEYYSRETVMIKPRSQSMPRHVEGLMTDEEVKQKIYGVSPAGVFGAASTGERKSRRDEPKRRGKFSLKKFLKFGSSKEDKKAGKEDKKKDRAPAAAATPEQRAKPEIIHPLDLTPGAGGVQVIVRSEEEKRRDEAERQRKKALLIAEGTRVYDSPSFSKGPLTASGRPGERHSPTSPAGTPSTPSTPSGTPWQHGSLGFNSEGRPKPPPPPRRTSSIDQSEVMAAAVLAPARPPHPPHPTHGIAEAAARAARDVAERVTAPRETEYANLGTNRAGLTPRKPDRGGSVRNESPKLRVAFEADETAAAASQQMPSGSPTGDIPTTSAVSPQSDQTPAPPSPSAAPAVAAAETDAELPRQRPSRVSLRKQTSVVHANLEENYDAVTASNHEALLQLLDQVSGRRPVPAGLRPLEHNPALAFTHFKVSPETHVTCGRRAFLRATHRDEPVLLMLSSEPAATPAVSLAPVAVFRDLVQGHLLPRASTGSYTSAMQATVWVLPPVSVRPLWDVVCAQPEVQDPQQEQQVCLLLLQTVHHLLQLQARGQMFVDQTLCELVTADAEGDPQSRLVAVYGNTAGRQRLTGCQAALAVMLRLLGVTDALERVADGRGVSVPDVPSLNAFELLASLLLREDATALSRARAVLEFLLWGPGDLELASDGEDALQRWLDLERATVLNNLIRTQKLWSVELSVLEEFRLMFLVNTDAATLRDASELLDI